MIRVVIALLMLLLGLAMAAGGGWLVSLNGSPYYLVAGAVLVLCALLLLMKRRSALSLYALLLIGTLGWSLWEAGLDWWALAPRGALLVLFGLLLVIPGVTSPIRGGRAPLLLAVLLSTAVAAVGYYQDPHNLNGELPGPVSPDAGHSELVPKGDWHAYGRTALGQRYSPLTQITPDNVTRLRRAWVFHTGDTDATTFEATPLKVGDTLYLCTPRHELIALDATTGVERWRFDPDIEPELNRRRQICRGVAYFPGHRQPPLATVERTNPQPEEMLAATGSERDSLIDPEDLHCEQRLFLPTADARLIALDADTGERCARFGGNGEVNLWNGMPNPEPPLYYPSSPPAVTDQLVIIGGLISDNVSVSQPSGVIRAYDVDDGRLVWNWDPGNPERTEPLPEGETYSASSPNSWSVASVDEALGMVYLPMGNHTPDQWGEQRDPDAERFSSSVVALDLATGKVRWVFQTVRHDLWDMDVPAQPSLLDLDTPQGRVPVLVQPTKQGDIYVLDRRTGDPVLPVREQPAPASLGYQTVATSQPSSALNFNPPPLRERDMWGATPVDQLFCRIRFRQLQYQGRYTPPSEQGSLIYPGNFGVFNWGALAVDPVRQVAFTSPSYLAYVSTLVPRKDDHSRHVSSRGPGANENYGAPYAVEMKPFLSPLGLPCQQPPWGYVAGADLRTGEVVWRHRNGTIGYPSPIALPLTIGVPDIGGPIITAGGVAFMSGGLDNHVRAYDLTSGRTLWEDHLPIGGHATPMTYLDDTGRQILLVVAGGHSAIGTRGPSRDAVIAYVLDDAAAEKDVDQVR